MASTSSTQQQAVREQNLNSNTNNTYANLFKTTAASPNPANSIKLKPISFFQGDPSLTFDSTDVEAYIKEENLQYALILKFSHGYPDIHEMRKHFPLQFKIKGDCNIGLIHPRHFLLRFSLVEDFINIYSRSVETILIKENGIGQEFEFRVQRWTAKFNPKEETSTALAWISFPGLPCQMFARQAIYSLASAVGRPLHVDKATADKTRPSTARVKVEVNLLSKLPDRLRLCYRDVNSGEISIEWQTIKYDKLPKYCTTCKKQGHGDEDCRLNSQQEQRHDSAGMGNLDKSHGDLRNKLNDLRKKAADGKGELDVAGRNLQLKSVPITTATEQEHITTVGHINDITNGNVSNSNTSPKGKETEHENGEEWELVQRKKHGRRRSPFARSPVANSMEKKEVHLVQESGSAARKIHYQSQTSNAMTTANLDQIGEKNGSCSNSQGKNQWVHGNCDSKESSLHVGKGQKTNMSQQNTPIVIGNHGDNQPHVSSSNLNISTPLSARTKIVEEPSSNIVLGGEQVHMDYNTKVISHGPTPPLDLDEGTVKTPQSNSLSLKQLPLEGPTQKGQDKLHQKSGKRSHGMGDHLKTRNTNKLGPTLLPTKANNVLGISNGSQNVNVHDLIEGPSANHLDEDNASSKNKASRAITTQGIPLKSDQLTLKTATTTPWADMVDDPVQGPEVVGPNAQNSSSHVRTNTKESVENVVMAMTQLNHDCQENKTAYIVPSQSNKLELCPSHSSNDLIPKQELELMFKLERLMKLHGTNLVTLDIAKKLTKQEHQIFLKIMRDSGYLCTSVAKGTEEQATPPKERPPQQPKRV